MSRAAGRGGGGVPSRALGGWGQRRGAWRRRRDERLAPRQMRWEEQVWTGNVECLVTLLCRTANRLRNLKPPLLRCSSTTTK